MSKLTDFLDRLGQPKAARLSPVPVELGSGFGSVQSGSQTGHNQDLFSPEIYGDYVATSNDVYSAAMLRAKNLAKLSLDFYDRNSKKLEDGGAVEALLRHVNPYWTPRRLLVQYELSMALWGQAYLAVEKNLAGIPKELWWVKPTRISPIVSKENYLGGYSYRPPGGGKPIYFDTSEILWFRYPNPIDEFSGLAPMAAARLAADFGSSAMHTNQKLFEQGLMMGGSFQPKDPEVVLDAEQANELEEKLARRFQGQDRAHRWAVFRTQWEFQEMGVSPKDASFVEGMNLSFRQVCRALGVPSQLLNDGEFATLANLSTYERQLWEHTMEFEASFFSSELNEQLLPLFRGSNVDTVAFDLSNVAALQEDKTEKEEREAAQVADGRLTINEWRTENGREPVPWGDVAWLSWNLVPVADSTPDSGTKVPVAEEAAESYVRAFRAADPFRNDEAALARILERLMARQLDAVISTINARTVDDAAEAPFDLAKWIAEYERAAKPQLFATIQHGTEAGATQVGSPISEEIAEALGPKVAEEANVQARSLAKKANETIIDDLRATIAAGLDDGADVDSITSAVRQILGPDSAEWRARRIATTETTRASSFGQLEVWRAMGVTGKRWVTQADSKVRDSHRTLHNDVVGLDQAFQVGSCVADGPGRSGCPEEDINCRCRLVPVQARSGEVDSLRVLREALGDQNASD